MKDERLTDRESEIAEAFRAGWKAAMEKIAAEASLVPTPGVVFDYLCADKKYVPSSRLNAADYRIVAYCALTVWIDPTESIDFFLASKETEKPFKPIFAESVDWHHKIVLGAVSPRDVGRALDRYGWLARSQLEALITCERGFFSSIDHAQAAYGKYVVSVSELLKESRVKFVPHVVDKSKFFPAAKRATAKKQAK